MLGDRKEINSGDKSTNVQAEEVTLHQHIGLSYAEVKEVALDVFRANFMELSKSAEEVVNARVTKFTENLFRNLERENMEILKEFENPDMQYVLYDAQKTYARTGNDDISKILIDALVERAKVTTESVKQLVLNESISVLSKITNEQLDILSTYFILFNSITTFEISTKEDVINYFQNHVLRFFNSVSSKDTNFQHLAYAGCCSISTDSYLLNHKLLDSYPGIFTKGFTINQFNDLTSDLKDKDLITKHTIYEGLFQLRASNNEMLIKLFDRNQTNILTREKLISLQDSSKITPEEVPFFLNTYIPQISRLFELWENTSMKKMTLTSVGICLAIMNINSKGLKGYNLSTWIE